MSLFSSQAPAVVDACPAPARARLSLISPMGTPFLVFPNAYEMSRVRRELHAMTCPCGSHPKLCRIPTAKGLS